MAKEDKSPDSKKNAEEESESVKPKSSEEEAAEAKAEAASSEGEAAEAESDDSAADDDSTDDDSTEDDDEGEDEATDEDDDSAADESEDDSAADADDEEDDDGSAAAGDEDERAHEHAAAGSPAHAHAHDDHGLAHTTTSRLLLSVFGALVVLTIATVAVTKLDLGGQGNLVVALIIATIKAGLVVAFFMHLIWDRKLNLLAFLSAVLFLILFLSLAITDRKEYQPYINQFAADTAAAQAK